MKKKRVAILISGRGSNMEAIVREAQSGVLHECCDPVLVVSSTPDAPGLAVARAMGVETRVLSSRPLRRAALDAALVALLEPYRIDYVVLAGFMRILGTQMIRRYRDRIVNVHPADTRLFRGIGGYEWAWESRLETTMITVHLVDEGVDTGHILAQAPVSLKGVESREELERRGLAVEHQLYSRVLRGLFTAADTGSDAPKA